MLPCKATMLTRWFGMLSLLILLDATQVSLTETNSPETLAPTVSSITSKSTDTTSESLDSTTDLSTSALTTKTSVLDTNTDALVTSTKPVTSQTLTPLHSTASLQVTSIKEATTLYSTEHDTTFTTIHDSLQTQSGTIGYPPSTNLPTPSATKTGEEEEERIEAELVKGNRETNNTIKCSSLRNLISTTKVICFKYSEETTCDTLKEEQKNKLQSYLCAIIGNAECDITIYSSEVNRGCILWDPSSQAEEDLIMHENASDVKIPVLKILGQVSDHQTRSQKTMIALVTCGVLLAFFILIGYFLSNRESWSPGRQRLGEDPYYTETDNQGNTLVSVSTNNQDKPNNGTKENGTEQTVTPTATNGHTNKKKNVSDTEL